MLLIIIIIIIIVVLVVVDILRKTQQKHNTYEKEPFSKYGNIEFKEQNKNSSLNWHFFFSLKNKRPR